MHFPYSHEIRVYRKPKTDPWGRVAKTGDETRYPPLFGRVYSHSLVDGGTIAPRVDERYVKAASNAPTTYTGATLFCGVDEDVADGDLLYIEDESGRKKVYEVEGVGDSDFISPFSGYLGGKEVYVGRYRPKKQ